MERRQLEYFLAIAEAGSFTRAARVLTIAQPTLSHAIRSLERELGETLFQRHGRGIRLTPAGAALVRPARRTVRSFAQAAGAVRGAGDDGFAQLRIVTNTVWALDPLVRIVGELRQLRPSVQLQVSDPASRTVVVEQVRAGEVDFGLVSGTPPGGPLSSLHLLDHELVAVLPPGGEQRPVADLAELADEGLISTPPGTALRDLLDELLSQAGLDGAVAVETAHVATVVPLILARAGAALLPEVMALEAAAKGARLSRLEPPSRARVHLLWRPDRLTDAGDALLAVAREVARS
ncbi:LysR family transcriptional regulator [Nocardioides currus]|uniref:LysR family transcriptional regulator n=1 Tax=Nocardioides currus TaxID=2133958 RepID=A0A2R7Z0D6_9ACTN|nr:LysR family transcriptional regulator [Nocardioides currus]PUA82083.1 LysR family transcriptional regulator [Nocardioides currus]